MKRTPTNCQWHSWLLLSVLAASACAHALTIDVKSAKLSTAQRTSLQRFLSSTFPEQPFDWQTMQVHAQAVGGKRQPLAVSLTTEPKRTSAGLCRSEQHRFQFDAAKRSGKAHWQAIDDLTSHTAWVTPNGECTPSQAPIAVGKSVSDAEFLFLEREQNNLRSRAAGVIGGSDCARVRYCEVALRRIDRVHEEKPLGKPRTLTKLTYSPLKPGPACLYVMEVSFVGALNELVPLGASCPRP